MQASIKQNQFGLRDRIAVWRGAEISLLSLFQSMGCIWLSVYDFLLAPACPLRRWDSFNNCCNTKPTRMLRETKFLADWESHQKPLVQTLPIQYGWVIASPFIHKKNHLYVGTPCPKENLLLSLIVIERHPVNYSLYGHCWDYRQMKPHGTEELLPHA